MTGDASFIKSPWDSFLTKIHREENFLLETHVEGINRRFSFPCGYQLYFHNQKAVYFMELKKKKICQNKKSKNVKVFKCSYQLSSS